jgi:methyl coenzyme M reductase gamma subunit
MIVSPGLTTKVVFAVGMYSAFVLPLARSHQFVHAYSTIKLQTKLPSGQVISIRKGDLTEENTEAIVNAGNVQIFHQFISQPMETFVMGEE